MKFIGIIPARYASSRFPGKPLAEINGKTMIQRVYEQAITSKCLTEVFVATDDERIEKLVNETGGKVVMTAESHQSGTDRCAEAIKKITSKYGTNYDVVINIQGDEPYIQPEQIDLLCSCFSAADVEIATLIKKITKEQELLNPNTPKVVINKKKQAIYFSRNPIPFNRVAKNTTDWLGLHTYYKHIGIYGYKVSVLDQLTQLLPSSLELAESLEQLRWIENGYRINVAETQFESIAIDTPEDLNKIVANNPSK